MSDMTAAVSVAQSYRARARFCHAETVDVPRPWMLRGLLDTAGHVAEIPCGAGHFLTEYAHARAAVTLVDACVDMLAAATARAHEIGLEQVQSHQATVQELPPLVDVDLVVLPNGALNQLAHQTPTERLLAGLCSVMRPAATMLVQVACTHPGGGTDTSTFYEPHRQHGVWFADRWFQPTQAAGAVLRRRRQNRNNQQLRIEFDYLDSAGERLHTTEVGLVLLPAAQLAEAFTAAGFVHVRFLPGRGGLSELLATAPDRRPQ